ncbi:hypothetical protein Lser_V15G30007 [Lactuca serriola]
MMRTRIDRSPHLICDGEFPWFKWVPMKVLCFAWRARLGRISTLLALSRRNVKVDSQWCSACISRLETSDHLLVDCTFVDHVWRNLEKWCGIGKINANSVRGVIDEGVRLKMGSNRKKKALFSILYGALWAIWRARNDRIFNGDIADPIKVVDSIKSMTFLWVKHRYGRCSINWGDWIGSPLNCL